MGTMKVVRIILIYGFISTCRASEELDSGQKKHAMNNLLNHNRDNIKNTHNKLNHNYYVRDKPQDIKQKRDDRSHPNKMTHEAKVSPKARPLNLRLDTVPRKLNHVPTVIKPIVKIPVPMLGRPVHNNNNNNKHLNTDDISRLTPKPNVNSKNNSIKVSQMPLHTVKPTVKQFFEDSDELSPKEHSKLTDVKTPESEIKVEKKAVIQPQFIENDDEDDDDDNQNEVKPDTTPHVDEKLKYNVTQNSTNEVIRHPHKDTEPVGSTNKIQKPVESNTENSTSTKEVKRHKGAEIVDSTVEKHVEPRIENSTSVEEITLVGVVFTKNESENENKMNIKVKLGGQPMTTERIKIEPNDTSLIISNHGFEELRERSTGYTADTSNVHENSNNNWNYNYPYYSYEKCNYNDPNNYQYNSIIGNYKTPNDYYNNDVYKPVDTNNYQVIDIKPDNTDRIYRSWKNTEVRICKGKNPINVDFENCYRDRSDIKMPYFYESRPVIGNGYYGYQNMAYSYA